MKRIIYLTTSARRCIAAVVLLFVALLPALAGGATSTYYYSAEVSASPSAGGKVYISNQSTNNPTYQTSSNTGTQESTSQTVNLYLYAQPNTSADYLFSNKWQESSDGSRWTDITVNNNNVQVTVTSTDENRPSRFYYRAVFVQQTGKVKVLIPDDEQGRGSISINPRENVIGGQVTLTAIPDASNGIHFLGWNKNPNDKENFITTLTPYEFTITNENQGTYYAHFSEAPHNIYCRIQNRKTLRFLMLYGNAIASPHERTVDETQYYDGFTFTNSLKLISEDDAKGNPMTVFLRSGYSAGVGITNGINLVANNIGYNNLLDEQAATNHYPITMVTTDRGVQIFTSYKSEGYTFNTYLTDLGEDYAVMQSDETKDIYWDVYLLEEGNTTGSFGANAKEYFEQDGNYYTTMFTYFPYQLLDGVKAYYLPLAQSSYTEETKTVHFTQITNGDDPVVVPMRSAVVLECTDPYNDLNNRLLPLMPEQNPNALPGTNLLNGYISISDNGEEPNKIENSDTRFILSKINGKLGWYYFTAAYMTPNKAFLDLSPWEEYYHKREAEARTIKFKFGGDESGEATGVIAPKYAEEVDGPLFDLNGRRVTNGDAYGLKKGVYISNGKKIVVK